MYLTHAMKDITTEDYKIILSPFSSNSVYTKKTRQCDVAIAIMMLAMR